MCGIYLTNLNYSKEQIEKKLKAIEFRGPDNRGIKQFNGVTLGHVRLSILDLDERSNQPFTFRQFTIIYNGEIYNFEEIKDELISIGYSFETTSDTEVIIKGYARWGKNILPKLNGMFAFAIYDSEKNEVFCARDRLGVKPFYYYWKDGELQICSQLRPLMHSDLTVSNTAISIYLDCGYIPSPFSIYEEVKKLRPGNLMVVDLNAKSMIIEQYWDLEKVKIDRYLTYDRAKNNLHSLIKDAVSIRMHSDVPFGSFLSGGIDSALISAIAAKILKQPLKTFTIAFDDPKFDESTVAEQFSKVIRSDHTATKCTPEDVLDMLPYFVNVYDEPFADSSALPSLLLNKVTKHYVTMALTGDGGDESFLGYKYFGILEKFKKSLRIPYNIRKLISYIPLFKIFRKRPETYKAFLKLNNENELIIKLFCGFDSLTLTQSNDWIDTYYSNFKFLSNDYLQKAADLNIKLWLENDSNTKVDRASMAFSVETRSPFLDYRIVEFARTLPISYRYRDGLTKRILRDILKEYIPEKDFNLPKRGFAVPIGEWMRTILKDDVLLKLNDQFLLSLPNFDVKKFKKQLQMHLDRKGDYTFNVWKLYVLALWYQNFKMI